MSSLISFSSAILIQPPFMYFNSNRKIPGGNLSLEELIAGESINLKTETVRTMMSKADLFKNISEKEAEESSKFLNELIKDYANGKFDKLESFPKNKIGLKIKPLSGEKSFPFDGLSSGQKEIISTLFLIWKYTRDYNGIILIDEPELHMNRDWQHRFIKTLRRLIPDNQYILATHSKEIFGSVSSEFRGLLKPDIS